MEPQTLGEFLAWEPNFPEAILGQGILYAGTKAIVYGKYKSLKSMLVQHLGLCISRGQPWLGIDTPKDGATVLYLQLEIPHPLLKRRIMKMSRGSSWTRKPIVFWTEHFLKLDTPLGMMKLEKYLNQFQPNVLIIDPVYKILSGNILDAHAIQTLLDNMDKLIEKYGIAIVFVSHTRKPMKDAEAGWGSDDLFGSMFFSAWADSVIMIERGDKKLRVKFDVIRHAEGDIEPVVVQIDEKLSFTPYTELAI